MSIVAIDIHPQKTFSELCPNELPVPDALSIVPHLNRQAAWAHYRVLTKDAHSPHEPWQTESQEHYLPMEMAGDWVSHAVLGTKGYESLPGLPLPDNYHFLVHIGLESHTHTFGACFHDMAENISTGLIEWLTSRNAETLIVGGLATEYCVQATVLQLCWYGKWRVIVNLDACRSLNTKEERQAIYNMEKAGALIAHHTDDIPTLLT
ncbi:MULTISPECIES: isochorismatase family protein [Neisseria]|uniref:nicotinamidase n=1 Tax=Neisseria musculi TaxID=1815583 RepID=A0A7H1MB88_9NEIS|nr:MULTISPECIES: isochorismatase family protein [Neisseria]MBF0803563.1 isochorismatase family protein [Neisseria sp. 19428wB4_WF04]QNT58903.1 isochorismatase family protein [Neisseria musculi]TFU43742.1 isochorismatase family protein [Neisseria sp. WF04]